MAIFADRGEFDALGGLYDEEIEVDYTSLSGGEIEMKSPSVLMSEWASVLPGFDRTRHEVSDVDVKIIGDRAEARAKVIADHYISELHWRVEGNYLYKLKKKDEGWKIVAHQFNLENEQGTRDVFAPAVEQAKKGPSPYITRQETQKTVSKFLKLLEEKEMEEFSKLWAKDAVLHMPYAPKGFPDRVVGRDQLTKHYASWPKNSGKADFTSNMIFYPMSDPEMIFVEFKGDVEVVSTGKKYEQSYGGLFHIRNGEVQLFREYFNPKPFIEAFDLKEAE